MMLNGFCLFVYHLHCTALQFKVLPVEQQKQHRVI